MEIVLPPLGTGPGVVVLHPRWGLNKTIRAYGAALAREGFVVGLPDLFDGPIATTIEAAEAQMTTNFETGTGKVRDAITELAAHPALTAKSVGAVGFSYGGFHLLRQLADATLPLKRAVIYYATYPLSPKHIPVLAHLAESDDFETNADMQDLTAALATAPNAAHTYAGTKHWFAESDRPEYDAAAATLAFERTVKFLKT